MFITNIKQEISQNRSNGVQTLESTPQMSLSLISLTSDQRLEVKQYKEKSHFYKIEAGSGWIIFYDGKEAEEIPIGEGDCILIQPGYKFEFMSGNEGLQMYTLVSPPEKLPKSSTESLSGEVNASDSVILASFIDYVTSKYKFSPLYYIITACKDLLSKGLLRTFDIINILTVLEGARRGTMIILDENWPFPAYSNDTTIESMLPYVGASFRNESKRTVASEYIRRYTDTRDSIISEFTIRLRKFFKQLQTREVSYNFYIYNEEISPDFETLSSEAKLGYLCPFRETIRPLYSYKIVVTDTQGYNHILYTVVCKDDPDTIKEKLNLSNKRIGRVINKYGLESNVVIEKM
jgi:mannose-6-phosphate isomerase-like protein (cupin superfamily)